MKNKLALTVSWSLIAAAFAACSSDDNPGKPSGPDGTAASAGDSSEAGEGGSHSSGGTDRGGSSGSTLGGADDGEGGNGGAGAQPAEQCSDVYADRPEGRKEIPVDQDGNITIETLTADTIWQLTGRYYVQVGRTLTIEPGTLIEATPKPNAGSLLVQRGATIHAVGTAEAPIVFTNAEHALTSSPWGGIVLLGYAPIAPGVEGGTIPPERYYEGLSAEPRALYGGNDADDNSGEMAYVRIEYGGDIIVANREINGLTFAGVGAKTDIHHIMVKDTADDCFEWFGGTVSAHHLICQNAGDDMFDTDEGYKGYLQFLFGRLFTDGSSPDPNGFEWDGNQQNPASAPETLGTPHASNATLCGLNGAGIATGYGAVLRRSLGSGTQLLNTIITGFDYGLDTRDNVGTNAAPVLSWTNSYFFDQLVRDTASPAEATDNDIAFNEAMWIADEANANVVPEDAPEGFDCYADPPQAPASPLTGVEPPEGFSDTASTEIGAGDLGAEHWSPGCWIDWE